MTPAPPTDTSARWRTRTEPVVRGFHRYANWLVSISWKRFFVLALLLLVAMSILHDLPPFTWTITERIEPTVRIIKAPKPPEAPAGPALPGGRSGSGAVDISIGKDGVRIKTTPDGAAPAASAASAVEAAEAAADAAADAAARAADAVASAADSLKATTVPPGAANDGLREALANAKREIEDAVREAREDARAAARDAEQARAEAEEAVEDITREIRGRGTRITRVGVGDFMMNFTLLWVVASAILKFTYKGRVQAEVKAAQATETAESESLKRQVVEARMAAMQAQVEPHFLFNTLASIDHLIETDPKRASTMQKNLIALLRASMPTMRETATHGVRELGRELDVIRPYLEILKVRMEERLTTEIDVPDGLLSAEFPPMMMQSLVENAIKHGLEPKPEGGTLKVKGEIVHGKLAVTVADTGLGFGKAATAGTGVGLANIRERLQLLYGGRASITVAENPLGGTIVTVTVPYKSLGSDAA